MAELLPEGTIEINDLIYIMSTSVVLYNLLPYVRRIALIETLRATTNTDQANHIFLENLSTSPYVPEEQRNELAELVYTHDLYSLYSRLECDENATLNNDDRVRSFREMVVTIFTKSKKIQYISDERRQQLGRAILSQTSIEGLKELALNALETSEVFNNDDRNMVANDIFDNRYDSLLLPNRFDCEELQRQTGPVQQIEDIQELDECPICLGTNEIDSQLPCNHKFCRSCIESWAESGNGKCPLCRREFSVEEI